MDRSLWRKQAREIVRWNELLYGELVLCHLPQHVLDLLSRVILIFLVLFNRHHAIEQHLHLRFRCADLQALGARYELLEIQGT